MSQGKRVTQMLAYSIVGAVEFRLDHQGRLVSADVELRLVLSCNGTVLLLQVELRCVQHVVHTHVHLVGPLPARGLL